MKKLIPLSLFITFVSCLVITCIGAYRYDDNMIVLEIIFGCASLLAMCIVINKNIDK